MYDISASALESSGERVALKNSWDYLLPMVLRLPLQFYEVSYMKSKNITVNVDIATVLDGKPVELEYIRQAIKEKKERDAGKKDAD